MSELTVIQLMAGHRENQLRAERRLDALDILVVPLVGLLALVVLAFLLVAVMVRIARSLRGISSDLTAEKQDVQRRPQR